MRLVTIGLALLVAGAAAAQQPNAQPAPEWQEVEGRGEVRAYIDRRSIRREGDRLSYRGRIVFPEPDPQGVQSLVHHGEISCARRDYRTVSFDALNVAGEVVESHSTPVETAPIAINPGSNNEALHNEFCR